MSPWGHEKRGKGPVQAGPLPRSIDTVQSPLWAAGWRGQAWQGGSDEIYHSAVLGIQAVGRAAAEGGRWNSHATTIPGGLIRGRREFRGMWENEMMASASESTEMRAHGGVYTLLSARCALREISTPQRGRCC